jgi:CRP-like cAMP-binding protein
LIPNGTAEFLITIPFFSSMNPEALGLLAESSDLTQFKKGRIVLFRGEIPTSVFVVRSGCVSLERKRPASVTTLAKGGIFAEQYLLEAAASETTVRATENDTTILEIPAFYLRGLHARARSLLN